MNTAISPGALRAQARAAVTRGAAGLRRLAWPALRAIAARRTPERPARLAIAAIVRNEGPYLLEWIAWHRCLGIRDFFIADNNSDDGATGLLAALQAAGAIVHLPFPGTPGVAPQIPAYRMIVARYASTAEWIAFIDADEFLCPTDPAGLSAAGRFAPGSSSDIDGSLLRWLGALPGAVGAVALNWANYGASGQETPGGGLVVERFTRRGPQAMPENVFIKGIVRMRHWRGPLSTPHGFDIAPWAFYIDTSGDLVDRREPVRGSRDRAVWGRFRLNHYAIKSRAEFTHKKLKRGRAATLTKPPRDDDYFRRYDRNDIEDAVPPAFLARVRAEMEGLRAALALPPEARDLDLALDAIGADAPARPRQAGEKVIATPFMQ